MGISTLTDISVTDRRVLYKKYSTKEDTRLAPNLPKGYLFFSLSCLNNLARVLRNCDPLPTAIIVDLDIFSIQQISPVLNDLRSNGYFSHIPVIGMANKKNAFNTVTLLKAGLDDCFFNVVNWSLIDARVRFLSEYKQQVQTKPANKSIEQYKVPLNKRIFDIVVASMILLALSPLLLLVAFLIKIESKGGIFYTSKRIGTGYQEFDFIKFRSMRENADAELKKLKHLNSYDKKSTNANTFFKIQNDPRVTRIGKIIRKTSIDELPQLINVLKGEMSIIGNRPLPLYEAKQLTKDDWSKRFLAPAGLTGLWQVDKRGKDNLSAEERVHLDVTYAKGVSFLMDIKILLKTVPAMWQRG